MDLDEIKLFLKIDNDEEDILIQSLVKASEVYLKNAGCEVNYENELYKLLIKILVSWWYDNRSVTEGSGMLSNSLQSIIYQLKTTNKQDIKK